MNEDQEIFNLQNIAPEIKSLLEMMVAWANTQENLIALYLFGSHIEGHANQLSDVDLAFLARSGLSRQQLWSLEDRYAARWSDLVDLRVLNLAPLPFCYEVTARGRRLWVRDSAIVADWESLTWRLYWDLKPWLEYYWQQHVIQIMERKSEAERRKYQTALAEVRAVHCRVREAAARYDPDLQK